MLEATVQILCEEGLEGATIPSIAAKAGIAPASVYRRFKDKDALLRAAFLQVFDVGGATAPRYLAPTIFAELSVEEAAARVVRLIFRQYRGAPKLLKAFTRFYENQTDVGFRKEALDRIKRNFANLTEALLATPELAGRAGAEEGVTLGLLTVITAIESIVLDPDSLWSILQPTTDEEIQAELARMLVGYVRPGG
jgi:AcrR family transcriptional regulator